MSPPDQSRPGGMQGSSDLLGSRLAVVEDRLRLLYAQRTADDHGDEPGEGSDEHQKNPAVAQTAGTSGGMATKTRWSACRRTSISARWTSTCSPALCCPSSLLSAVPRTG